MNFPTFASLTDQLVHYFQNKQYAEALDLVTREGPRFPADRVWADYWRMCAAARVGNRALVWQIAEGALAEGLWYGQMMWRQTPSFQPLQGDPEFERIVAASRAAEERDTPSAAPLLTRLPEDHSSTSPLLIALHGNQRTAAATLPFWQAAVTHGWVLALPQSRQAMYKGAYAWDDVSASFASVQADFARVKELTAFDVNRTVLAGHSMGGLIAIQMALTAALNVRGFVVNGPAVPFLDAAEALQSLLTPARERGLRGYFILGADDTDINAQELHAFAATLQSAGIACELETVPNATHDYDPAYDAALRRALVFIAGA